jgi:hypothetical protein
MSAPRGARTDAKIHAQDGNLYTGHDGVVKDLNGKCCLFTDVRLHIVPGRRVLGLSSGFLTFMKPSMLSRVRVVMGKPILFALRT